MTALPPLSIALDNFFERGRGALVDPYSLYARLRQEDPVHRRESKTTFYIITRYADVAAVLRDPRFSSDHNYGGRVTAFMRDLPPQTRQQGLAVQHFLERIVLTSDPPEHMRLRRLMVKAFTPKIIEEMVEPIQRLTEELLDTVVQTGRMDVISEFASPLAAGVILQLLGIPATDWGRLQHWSEKITVFFDGMRGIEESYENMLAFRHYMKDLIEDRRLHPGSDLLSALVSTEERGHRLSDDDIAANVLNLVFAGYQPMVGLIGNGLLALLLHPDQQHMLQRNPHLLEPAVEELLRYDGPDQAALRIATEDCQINNTRIEAGQAVSLWLGAANRDGDQFPNPDHLDITRNPNRHLAFSHGSHFCLGVSLARLEGRVAIGTLIDRLPDLRLANGHIEWQENLTLRSLKALEIRFDDAGSRRLDAKALASARSSRDSSLP
jgi:pimeloyl-[acyl-carrier protein] synthase